MNRRLRVIAALGAEGMVGLLLIAALATQGYRAWGVTGAVLVPAGCIAVGAAYLVLRLRRTDSPHERSPSRGSRVNPWLLAILAVVVGLAAYLTTFFPRH
jgi:hypothetical protein